MIVLVSAVMAFSPARADDCDRNCLTNMITNYVDAIVAHDPLRLPLAGEVRYTEDSRKAELGKGLWQTVTRKGGFRQDYLDVTKQIAAAHILLFEESMPILYSLVLHTAAA